MASKKLNVLVYSGPGTTAASLQHALRTLRFLLHPNYAVFPLPPSALLHEPWAPTCALLVLPGGADLPFCSSLNGPGTARIAAYVRAGGAYLGLCAGGYFGCRQCEFEVGNPVLEVVGPRELAFFPGTCRGAALGGFVYGSEKGARAARLRVVGRESLGRLEGEKETVLHLQEQEQHRQRYQKQQRHELPDEFRCYYNGGGVFVDAQNMAGDQQVEVLAEYAEETVVESGDTRPAIVFCRVGSGAAIVSGVHPEFAAANLTKQPDVPGYDDLIQDLAADDAARLSFMAACLSKLRLEVNEEASWTIPPLSELHLSCRRHAHVSELLFSLTSAITVRDDSRESLDDHDIFSLERPGRLGDSPAVATESSAADDVHDDNEKVVHCVVCHENGWPTTQETPSFNHHVFYSMLQECREQWGLGDATWGDTLLYGSVVTSTNTLLEKNPILLSHLPSGTTFTATTQLAGRGRGSNVWLAPAGSLVMSTVIHHPLHLSATRPIIFIQYLAAMAVVDAVRACHYPDALVKIKWPNDIYAIDPDAASSSDPAGPQARYVKIGGILSSCSYADGMYHVVLGIGLNVANARPTTSLAALLPLARSLASSGVVAAVADAELPRVEQLLARILARFETRYAEFLLRGFWTPLEIEFYRCWLHTDQVVTLENEGNTKARILGITRDWGLLRAEELQENLTTGALEPSGRLFALQSDENSFDFWEGLIRRKL